MGLRTITRALQTMPKRKCVPSYEDIYETISRFVDYINVDFTAINNLKRTAQLRKKNKSRYIISDNEG